MDIHAIAIQSLQSKWHHSVVCFIHSRFERVNCVKFAFLDLDWNIPVENEDAIADEGFLVGTKLIKLLLVKHVLVKTSARRADYAIYFRKGKITHIGMMRKHRKVLSKWGKGLVYEHGPKEVPVNYGNPVFYRHAVSKQYTYQKVAEALQVLLGS